MKKLLLSSILGLAALALWAAPSHAGCYFGLIPHHCCCHGCGKCCCLPYNAFSPNPCCCNPCCWGGNYGGFPGCGPGGCPAGPIGETLPASDGCAPAPTTAPVQPVPQTTPPPAAKPLTEALPYGGPVQASGAYGYAPMLPPTVMPMGGQPYYYGGYGR